MNDGCITIGGRKIGPGRPVYIVAEMSANHQQDISAAIELVHLAKDAGADAVKLQTYTPDTLTIRCDNDYFLIKGTLWDGRTLYDLYGEASTPWEWQLRLKRLAEDLGMHCFSTPFDATAVDFLEKLDVPAHKIASFELVDIPLLRKVGATGRPVLLSTGMASLDEIGEAVVTLRSAGCTDLALLKCTSAYPADPADMNLRTIPDMAAAFGVPVGISDHSLGWEVDVAAVALGACIVEKHLTKSRSRPGPDSAFSVEPAEFKAMAAAIRLTEAALGRVAYGAGPVEEKSRVFRRSLFVVEDVKAGELFSARNVRPIRPGYGLHPRHLDEIVGRRALRDVPRGTPFSWDLLAP
jgi:N-acetylneuraminate synthase